MVKVTEIKALDGHRLWVRFSDGMEGVHDCSAMIARGGPVVGPLQDHLLFARVFISYGVPTWPNGFDMDAINLHMQMEKAGALRSPMAAE